METEKKVKKGKNKKKSKKTLRRWLWPIEKLLVFIVIVGIIFTYEFSAHLVEGGAMYPYLQDSTLVLYYRHGKVVRNLVVAYKADNKMRTGRVIGIPGDKVSVEAGKCYVNGVEQESFYRIKGSVKEHTIGANTYFILNDYRYNTQDSRDFGDISAQNIEGTYFCSFHTGVM